MSGSEQRHGPAAGRWGIPAPVWLLGWVSLFADLSTELVYPIVPIFLTTTLGAPAVAVGVTEGVAEATANVTRLVSGRWSDRASARKPFVVAGYALAALGKLVLSLAPAWGFAVAGRAVDRFGKGIRSSPRDALLADFVGGADRGRVFGFHRSMDSMGAVGGPLLGLAFLALVGEHLRMAIALAVVPGLVAVAILRWLPERPQPAGQRPAGGGIGQLPRAYWLFLAATVVFMAGNSSDAFLLLRSKDLGLSTTLVVLAYVGYNSVYALGAFPAGVVSDRLPRPALLVGGYLVFAGVYSGFAFAGAAATVWPLFACYGVYMALTDGVTKAFVVDLSPAALRSTAIGLFQGVAGMTVLGASIGAGLLWDHVSPAAPFYVGAACSLGAATVTAGLLISGALRPPPARIVID